MKRIYNNEQTPYQIKQPLLHLLTPSKQTALYQKLPNVFSPAYLRISSVPKRTGVIDIRYIEESVFIFVLLINTTHESGVGRQDFVDENENGLLGSKLDAFPNNVTKLSNGQVRRNKIFLLVYCGNVRLFNFLTDNLGMSNLRKGRAAYGDSISVFLPNALGLGLALLKGMFVFELRSHCSPGIVLLESGSTIR